MKRARDRRKRRSIASRPERRARRLHGCDRDACPRQSRRYGCRPGARDEPSGRSPACRSRSRTCSTSMGWRRARAPRSTATAPPAKSGRNAVDASRGRRRAFWSARSTWANTPTTSPAENAHDGPSRNPHDLAHMTGGSSGGSGSGGGRRPGSDRAGFGHQRLHSRAELVLRIVRPQADLWPAVARRQRFRSSPASIMWAARALRRRSRALLRRHAGPRRERPGASRHARGAGIANARRRRRWPAHREARRLFRALGRRRAPSPRWTPSRAR